MLYKFMAFSSKLKTPKNQEQVSKHYWIPQTIKHILLIVTTFFITICYLKVVIFLVTLTAKQRLNLSLQQCFELIFVLFIIIDMPKIWRAHQRIQKESLLFAQITFSTDNIYQNLENSQRHSITLKCNKIRF